MASVTFTSTLERGCGLDVHKQSVVASVSGEGILPETRTFGTYTDDLYQLAGWLQNLGVTHVAMESTGVYWKPVYHILEDFFTILLVNARHIKNVPGHKTDKKDSEWITKLLMGGLLKGSFVPNQHIRELRILYRHRRKLIHQRTSEKNRLQNVLEDANIKLASVVSDVFGKTGLGIVEALIAGVTDPKELSELARGSLIRKKDMLQKALYGRITDHHRFMLLMIVKNITYIDNQIAQFDDRIKSYVNDMRQEMELLQTIPGVSIQVATGILAETGADMSVFPSAGHLASWAGVCPGNNESAGKKKSSKITSGNKYLKTTLVEAAWSASRSKTNPVFAIKHRSLAIRRGLKKANVAIGHKILIAAFYILKDKTPFVVPTGKNDLLEIRKKRRIERLEKELNTLKGTSA